jgi:CheY-like chemotaxis protein
MAFDPMVRVLVVHDRDRERARMAAAMRADGYSVRTAPSVAQALRMLAHATYDLIVTNSFLDAAPGGDAEALSALLTRAHGARIIVVTSEATEEEKSQPSGERKRGSGGLRSEPRVDRVDLARLREEVRAALTQ